MGHEIEAKFSITTPTDIEKRVKETDGQFRFVRFETNIFFDTRLANLDKKGEVLRIRIEEYLDGKRHIVMTFKGRRKRGKLKCRDEHETIVHSYTDAEAIIKALGYRETFRFEKKRTKYLLGDCSVEIDELPRLGFFCEIEGKNEASIRKVMKKLGCSDVKLITDGYGSLLRTHAQANKLDAKKVLFPCQSTK